MCKTFCGRPYDGVLPGKRNWDMGLGGRETAGKRALEQVPLALRTCACNLN